MAKPIHFDSKADEYKAIRELVFKENAAQSMARVLLKKKGEIDPIALLSALYPSAIIKEGVAIFNDGSETDV